MLRDNQGYDFSLFDDILSSEFTHLTPVITSQSRIQIYAEHVCSNAPK